MSYSILYLELRAAENVRGGTWRLPPSQINIVFVPFKRVYHPPNDICKVALPRCVLITRWRNRVYLCGGFGGMTLNLTVGTFMFAFFFGFGWDLAFFPAPSDLPDTGRGFSSGTGGGVRTMVSRGYEGIRRDGGSERSLCRGARSGGSSMRFGSGTYRRNMSVGKG